MLVIVSMLLVIVQRTKLRVSYPKHSSFSTLTLRQMYLKCLCDLLNSACTTYTDANTMI